MIDQGHLESRANLCRKVWAADEHEPHEGELSNLTSAPKTWFREEPRLAAELYALERWGSTDQQGLRVYVRDDAGKVHEYRVRLQRVVDCKVTVEELWKT